MCVCVYNQYLFLSWLPAFNTYRISHKILLFGPSGTISKAGSQMHTEAGARRHGTACQQGHPFLSTLWSHPVTPHLLCAALVSSCPCVDRGSCVVLSSFDLYCERTCCSRKQLITIVKGMLKSNRPRLNLSSPPVTLVVLLWTSCLLAPLLITCRVKSKHKSVVLWALTGSCMWNSILFWPTSNR